MVHDDSFVLPAPCLTAATTVFACAAGCPTEIDKSDIARPAESTGQSIITGLFSFTSLTTSWLDLLIATALSDAHGAQ